MNFSPAAQFAKPVIVPRLGIVLGCAEPSGELPATALYLDSDTLQVPSSVARLSHLVAFEMCCSRLAPFELASESIRTP
jgi:hypothetical protein